MDRWMLGFEVNRDLVSHQPQARVAITVTLKNEIAWENENTEEKMPKTGSDGTTSLRTERVKE